MSRRSLVIGTLGTIGSLLLVAAPGRAFNCPYTNAINGNTTPVSTQYLGNWVRLKYGVPGLHRIKLKKNLVTYAAAGFNPALNSSPTSLAVTLYNGVTQIWTVNIPSGPGWNPCTATTCTYNTPNVKAKVRLISGQPFVIKSLDAKNQTIGGPVVTPADQLTLTVELAQSGTDTNASCLGDTIGNIMPHFPCTSAGSAPTVTCKY